MLRITAWLLLLRNPLITETASFLNRFPGWFRALSSRIWVRKLAVSKISGFMWTRQQVDLRKSGPSCSKGGKRSPLGKLLSTGTISQLIFVILILWIISLFKICISNSIEEQTDSFPSSLVSFMNILPKEKFLSVRYRKKRNKKLCANGRNNSQNYVANNVGSCCVRDGSGMQTGASTLKIMWPTMLAVVASVMAVVCKQVHQLSTMLGLAVHHGKDTTHKTL